VFVCFSFHDDLLFKSTFRLSNRAPKITRILTQYQASKKHFRRLILAHALWNISVLQYYSARLQHKKA